MDRCKIVFIDECILVKIYLEITLNILFEVGGRFKMRHTYIKLI